MSSGSVPESQGFLNLFTMHRVLLGHALNTKFLWNAPAFLNSAYSISSTLSWKKVFFSRNHCAMTNQAENCVSISTYPHFFKCRKTGTQQHRAALYQQRLLPTLGQLTLRWRVLSLPTVWATFILLSLTLSVWILISSSHSWVLWVFL